MNLTHKFIAASVCLVACSPWTLTLPPVDSPTPVATGMLQAGFGRSDITPPPGLSLAGYGPEGHPAIGHRTRLQARALYLETADGQRLAFVVTDLDFMAAHVQRLVAQRIVGVTGIGADRLLIMATHTHSGPAHFQDAEQMNQFAGSLQGYSAPMARLLVNGISQAVLQAYHERAEARVGWLQMNVWGMTRNRSLSAFRRNPWDPWPESLAPEGLPSDSHRTVDPTWRMLRVDLRNTDGVFMPAGAFSIFALHGTANPNVDSLYDADLQGLISSRIERDIDEAAGRSPGRVPVAVHLMANGTEGDVSPVWPAESRACAPPRLVPASPRRGPRSLPAAPEWLGTSATAVQRCIGAARNFAAWHADSLARMASRLFRSAVPGDGAFEIRRAFAAVPLTGGLHPPELCNEGARAGVPLSAGGPDGISRLEGWKLFGVLPMGFHAGATGRDRGCHGLKIKLLGPLQPGMVASGGLPAFGTFSVVALGHVTLATLPIEVTTRSGLQIRTTIADSLRAHGKPLGPIAVVSLTNGYLQYLATRDEYQEQLYEGAATIYGPGSATAYAGVLGHLAVRPGQSPDDGLLNQAPPLTIRPGDSTGIGPPEWRATIRPSITRTFRRSCWHADTLIVEWLDHRPGHLQPNVGPIVRFDTVATNGSFWLPVTWDDDRAVEVRVIRLQRGSAWWQAKWIRPSLDRVRVVLEPRMELPELGREVSYGCN